MSNRGYALPFILVVLMVCVILMTSVSLTQRKEHFLVTETLKSLEKRIISRSLLEAFIYEILNSNDIEDIEKTLKDSQTYYSITSEALYTTLSILIKPLNSNMYSYRLFFELITLENMCDIFKSEMSGEHIIADNYKEKLLIAEHLEVINLNYKGLIVCEEISLSNSIIEGVLIVNRVNSDSLSKVNCQVFFMDDYGEFSLDGLSSESKDLLNEILREKFKWLKLKKILEFK